MRVLFMGTPDIAASCLSALAASHHELCGVVTSPDKPRGRKYVMTPPPVKVTAEALSLPVSGRRGSCWKTCYNPLRQEKRPGFCNASERAAYS